MPASLSTEWSRRLGLTVPILNAPMGGVAGGRLAAAVTAAGGLGMIGMGSLARADGLATELDRLGPVRPFGVGLIDWVRRQRPDLLDAALAAAPTLLAVSFCTDFDWVPRAHAAGAVAVTQVYCADDASRAQDAGVDVLVARGAEGGGHGEDRLGTLVVLDTVLEVAQVPVLAGGGIASPRSLAAVLAAGAAGAWLGTALSACPEALTPASARRALLAADGTDTIATDVFDIGQRLPWPSRFPARALRNDYLDRWAGRTDQQRTDSAAVTELAAGIAADDRTIAPVDAGQGVGLLTAAEPAGVVIERLCTGAAELLGRFG